MDKFVINGGKPLKGNVVISGAKNAAVAIVAATILADEPCVLENVPEISDINIALRILYEMGAGIKILDKNTMRIDPRGISDPIVPYELARSMRASSYFLGTLLGRFKKADVPMPGGCDLGDRPIDQHLKAFNSLGATHSIDGGIVSLRAEELIGNQVYFDVNTVGGTINAIFAAVKAKGLTVLENAAKEPHIVDLANFLNTMGADIMGAGTDVIKIRGVNFLKGVSYAVIPDQIEAGTYMVAAAATKGDVWIKNVIPKHLESITAKLIETGATVEEFDDAVHVTAGEKIKKTNVKTLPYPGFPTDMHPQMTALLCLAEGTSYINESIYENRFRYVEELKRMGARIKVDGRIVVIEGGAPLSPAPVIATDLRGGVAVLIAALTCKGKTDISEIRLIERGYDNICEKLKSLGADIEKVILPDNVEIQKAN